MITRRPSGSERRTRPVVRLPSGSERVPSVAVLRLPNGSERVVWRRGDGSAGVMSVSAPTTYPSVVPESIVFLNTNRDRLSRAGGNASYNAAFDPHLNTQYPASKTWLRGYRESFEGNYVGNKPTIDWGSSSWTHLSQMMSNAFMGGGRTIFFQPLANNASEGSPVYGTSGLNTWADYVRWKIYQATLGGFPISIVLSANECDNAGTAGSYESFVRDFYPPPDPEPTPATIAAAKATPEAIAAAIGRIVAYERAVYEELNATTLNAGVLGNRWYMPAQHAALYGGPSVAYCNRSTPTITDPLTQLQRFDLDDLFQFNQGEVLDYYDVINVHNHRVQSRIESFTGGAVASGSPSLYHAWAARDAANTIRVGAGKAARIIPVMTGETGVQWDSALGTLGWADGNWPHKLRQYRMGVCMAMMHWYGVSAWAFYAESGSGHPEQELTERPNFVPYAAPDGVLDRDVWEDICDLSKYDINLFTSAVPNKNWDLFNRPYSWAVHLDQNAAPVAAPPNNPIAEWGRVTMNGTTFACAAGGRNVIYRPVYFRQRRRYRFTVEVNTGGTVALRVRGHDKLNGLTAISTQSTAASGFPTIGVEFTPQQHGLAGLPDPCSALFVLDHNGTGTASWRNPQIVPV